MADILAQRIAELGVVRGAEVYFILGAVEAKTDGAICLTAVDVIDEAFSPLSPSTVRRMAAMLTHGWSSLGLAFP